MPESTTGKKLSYKSLGDCLRTAKNDADKSACAKHFPEDTKKSKQSHRATKGHFEAIYRRGMKEA